MCDATVVSKVWAFTLCHRLRQHDRCNCAGVADGGRAARSGNPTCLDAGKVAECNQRDGYIHVDKFSKYRYRTSSTKFSTAADLV